MEMLITLIVPLYIVYLYQIILYPINRYKYYVNFLNPPQKISTYNDEITALTNYDLEGTLL